MNDSKVVNVVTTQRTSKFWKLCQLLCMLLMGFSIYGIFSGDESLSAFGIFGVFLGIVGIFIIKIAIWWCHE